MATYSPRCYALIAKKNWESPCRLSASEVDIGEYIIIVHRVEVIYIR